MSNGVAYYLNKFYELQIKENGINVENLGISQKLSKGKIIFRGQANEEWNIMSSAGRRLFSTGNFKQKEFISYHVNLIENARKFGYGNLPAGSQSNDLELLAQIQHYGGATCLVDFTTNFLIALWMATEKNNYKRECEHFNIEDKFKDTNGKILWLDLGNESNQSNILYYNKYKKGDSIQSLLMKVQWSLDNKQSKVEPCFWYWEPTKLNNRIVMQDSIFLFGLSAFPKVKDNSARLKFQELTIASNDKKRIREELESIFGICAETVYPDLIGYSLNANNFSVNISDKLLPKFDCLYNAKESFKKEQYDLSIRYLDDAINCKKKNSDCKYGHACNNGSLGELLYWKALAINKTNRDEEALLNFYLAANDLKATNKLSKEDSNRLLCSCYRKTSIIQYSKKNYIDAIRTERELAKIYIQNSYNQENEDLEKKDGADGIFALWELSIMTNNLKIFENDKEYNFKEIASYLFTQENNNCKILYLVLDFFSKQIFNTNNHDKSVDITDIISDIEIQTDKIIENIKPKEIESGLIGYFYWSYADLISWVEDIRKKDKLTSDEKQFNFIAENATNFILIAEKAQEAQDRLLNKMFSINDTVEK